MNIAAHRFELSSPYIQPIHSALYRAWPIWARIREGTYRSDVDERGKSADLNIVDLTCRFCIPNRMGTTFLVDYRKLYSETTTETYPFARLDEYID